MNIPGIWEFHILTCFNVIFNVETWNQQHRTAAWNLDFVNNLVGRGKGFRIA